MSNSDETAAIFMGVIVLSAVAGAVAKANGLDTDTLVRTVVHLLGVVAVMVIYGLCAWFFRPRFRIIGLNLAGILVAGSWISFWAAFNYWAQHSATAFDEWGVYSPRVEMPWYGHGYVQWLVLIAILGIWGALRYRLRERRW